METLKRIVIILALGVVSTFSGMPALKSAKVTIDPYLVPSGGSNAVIAIYKSTYLGTGLQGPVYTPFKPTAYFPASRTNFSLPVLVGYTYQFYATAQVQPYGEAVPSNIVTYTATAP